MYTHATHGVDQLLASVSALEYGIIRWFDDDQRLGFITPDDGGPDVLVHASEIDGYTAHTVVPGLRVSYLVSPSPFWPDALSVHALKSKVLVDTQELMGQ